MKYLSLCSGIEAATVAWHPLGWEAVAYSEIERFPSEVLAHHYPNTPNLGDMTKFKEWTNVSDVDLLVGGTPCQSFSVAGLRKGLDDPRGNLMLTYLAIADKYRPRWLVWENVPGVLSSNSGKDFGVFLGALGELGYGFAYRVLDAQYFGVAQRRKRVFVVGYLGDWRAAAAVLFERHSLQGHPAPSREKRQSAAASTGAGADGGGFEIKDLTMPPVYEMHGQDSRVRDLGDTCSTVTSKWGTGGGNVPVALQPIAFTTEQTPKYNHDQALTLTKQSPTGGGQPQCVAQPAYGIPGNWIGRKPENGGNATEPMYDVAPCLTKADQHGVAAPSIIHGTQDPCVSDIAFAQGRNNGGENVLVQPMAFDLAQITSSVNRTRVDPSLPVSTMSKGSDLHVASTMAVRRLTPVECERLQGFSDNYTDIKSKNKPTPDGPRYKALGNSMAVPVMAWIGQRIEQVEAICKQNK